MPFRLRKSCRKCDAIGDAQYFKVPGIYLHIPFCRKACTYCDFHFSTSLALKDRMVAALRLEMEMRRDFFGKDLPLTTLYFGGGTPSTLTIEELESILQAANQLFPFVPNPEITLEANPDDLHPEYLKGLKEIGINRLSIGVQSFREADLVLMNRSHNAMQSIQAVKDAQAAGFENITIDLIYGIPGMSEAEWEAHVRQAADLGVPHISAYALTVEPRTPLNHQVQKGTVILPPDEAYTTQFRALVRILTEAGFEHYELSNFAKPGFRSKHNGAYWEGEPYLSIGPSAHAFHTNQRSWNIRNNALYLREIENGALPTDQTEELSAFDRANERIMTGLRRAAGVDLAAFQKDFGVDLLKENQAVLHSFLASGWIHPMGSHLQLTTEGMMVSDHIIAELFLVEE